MPARTLPRESASVMRERWGDGGWSPEALPPPFTSDRCDADMLDAQSVTAEEVCVC